MNWYEHVEGMQDAWMDKDEYKCVSGREVQMTRVEVLRDDLQLRASPTEGV